MASGEKLYDKILKDIPIEETETVKDYATRVYDELISRGMDEGRTIKGVTDSIRPYLPSDRQVRVKRGETLNAKGETVSEKYGFVKDIEPEDKVNFQATKITTNPYGTEWVKYEKKKLDYFNIKDAIIKDMENYIPEYPIIKREQSKNSHLLVVDPADIHIGKLSRAYESGDEYNSDIAVNRVLAGVSGLLNKSIGFNADKILLVIGNDILHTDSPKRITTSGTPQDTDGMWYDNFLTAKSLYVKVIEQLMQIADLTVHYNPSNHDYTSGFYLADCLATWFRTSQNVSFNTDISHRKYLKYHSNLIGTTHGDGAKDSDLPLLMAQESRDWTDCKHRYIYTHHIHHKKSKDYGSVCIESLRSPSGTDSWHHRNGYQHSPKAVEMFIHDKNDGQIARINHIF
jgi:hypothetical protein